MCCVRITLHEHTFVACNYCKQRKRIWGLQLSAQTLSTTCSEWVSFQRKKKKLTMACAAMATAVPFGLRYSPSCSFMAQLSRGSVQLAQFNRPKSLRLSSSHSISGLAPLLPHRLCTIASSPLRPRSLTIVSAKGYKMKTHKVFRHGFWLFPFGYWENFGKERMGKSMW